MKTIKLILGSILVGISVALVYFVFEASVRLSTDYVWNSLFHSDITRWLIVPLCLVGAVIFFGLQHWLDRSSETHEEHGLGESTASASWRKLGIILALGYFSLLAGASLGPEAVLVPACMVVGLLLSSKIFKDDTSSSYILAALAIIALMAAFFHSYIVGLLAIFLVKKQGRVPITPLFLILAVVASVVSYYVLLLIDPASSYFNFGKLSLNITVADILIGVCIIAAGYAATFALKYSHKFFIKIKDVLSNGHWLREALIASLGLCIIYLVGGPLIQFTGNESIMPLFQESSTLGVLGVLLILVTKIIAIAWSKAIGYRGGLIFPMVFVASSIASLMVLIFHGTNFGIIILAALIGILLAERKAKILF